MTRDEKVSYIRRKNEIEVKKMQLDHEHEIKLIKIQHEYKMKELAHKHEMQLLKASGGFLDRLSGVFNFH